MIVTLAIIAPLSAAISDNSYSWWDAVSYVWCNSASWINQWGISGGPSNVPDPGVWNRSLWTLIYELVCYVMFGIFLGATRPRAISVLSTVLAVTTGLLLLDPLAMHVLQLGHFVRFAGFFAAGALLFYVRDQVPPRGLFAVGCAAVVGVALTCQPRVFFAAAPLPLAYLLMFAGATVPIRVGSVTDISYGMYVYGFPIQQLLLVTGIGRFIGPELFAVASVAATAPLALGSWLAVERPALRTLRSCGSSRLSSTTQRV